MFVLLIVSTWFLVRVPLTCNLTLLDCLYDATMQSIQKMI